jgi:deazaflavin-dependent oxidoreductase (nitroreductase family)
VADFDPATLQAIAREREVRFITHGRRSGKSRSVTIWVSSDGRRVFIRSGGGLKRYWPQNLLASGTGTLRVGGADVPVLARQVTDPAEARGVTDLVIKKYGVGVRRSPEGGPLSLGEQATFELLPA